MKRALALLVVMAVTLAACVGTTGGDVVDFPVAAAGAADAVAGQPYELVTDRGWHVVLTKATLHVGALYLGQSLPVSGAQNTSCILPGTYVAQVTTGLDVDLLSPAPQRFPSLGHGTTLQARVDRSTPPSTPGPSCSSRARPIAAATCALSRDRSRSRRIASSGEERMPVPTLYANNES
jgi:predicted small secreted protein